MDRTATTMAGVAAERPEVNHALGVKVWDLPTRLFHWALVACVGGAIATAQVGGNWMDWHMRLGIATVALLVFRIVWGLIGPRYARFRAFLYSPRRTVEHLRSGHSPVRDRTGGHAGHSPSGALSVFAILTVLLGQAVSGLFSSDSISTEGPLVRFAGEATISSATWVHVRLQWIIYALIALHVIAVIGYLVVKKDNLIVPMLTGFKRGIRAQHAADSMSVRIGGLVLFMACAVAAFRLLG